MHVRDNMIEFKTNNRQILHFSKNVFEDLPLPAITICNTFSYDKWGFLRNETRSNRIRAVVKFSAQLSAIYTLPYYYILTTYFTSTLDSSYTDSV